MYDIFGWQRKLLLWECLDASEMGDKKDKAFIIKIQPPAGSKISICEIYLDKIFLIFIGMLDIILFGPSDVSNFLVNVNAIMQMKHSYQLNKSIEKCE